MRRFSTEHHDTCSMVGGQRKAVLPEEDGVARGRWCCQRKAVWPEEGSLARHRANTSVMYCRWGNDLKQLRRGVINIVDQ